MTNNADPNWKVQSPLPSSRLSGRMFLEPDHSVIDFPAPAQAVLSQNSLQHLDNLYATHRASLDQADQYAPILHHPNCKKPSLSLKLLMFWKTTSSYLTDSLLSR